LKKYSVIGVLLLSLKLFASGPSAGLNGYDNAALVDKIIRSFAAPQAELREEVRHVLSGLSDRQLRELCLDLPKIVRKYQENIRAKTQDDPALLEFALAGVFNATMEFATALNQEISVRNTNSKFKSTLSSAATVSILSVGLASLIQTGRYKIWLRDFSKISGRSILSGDRIHKKRALFLQSAIAVSGVALVTSAFSYALSESDLTSVNKDELSREIEALGILEKLE
jgi:hypothetical protein